MSAKYPLTLAVAVVAATILAMGWSSAQRGEAAGVEVSARTSPVVRETLHLTPAQLAALQAAPQQGSAGIGRLFSESFEANPFPPRGSKWAISDSCASLPGQNDVIAWGRQDVETTVGAAGLWAVGGGSVGKTLSAEQKQYPTVRSGVKQCDGIRTQLVYSPMDYSGVPYGMRVTFDFKAKMPNEALYIGVGDLDKPNDQGGIDLVGFRNFKADTAGDWERGVHVELNNAARVKKVLLAFIYADPPPSGAGAMSTGVYGVFIDNVHVDTKFTDPAPYIPSPTATESPTETPTPRPTITRTRRPTIPPDTPTPTRPTPTPGVPRFYMPLSMKFAQLQEIIPPPTAPTATATPTNTPTLTPRPTATDTPEPTETPLPTDTPVPTPTPSRTPVPVPDVRILSIMYEYDGAPRKELEIVTLKNLGTAPQDMTGWRVAEEYNTSTCRIPDGVIIPPDGEYEIRSGKDAQEGVVNGIPGTICLALGGFKRPIWDNEGDKGTLYNPNTDAIDCLAYTRKAGFYRCL